MITTVKPPNPDQPNPDQPSAHPGQTFAAVVTDIRLRDRAATAGRARWQVALDQTEFQPGDAGEIEAVAARSGARLAVPVVRVEVDAAGELWHVVEKPIGTGTRVTGVVRSRGVAV